MPKKIIRSEETYKIENFQFKVFHTTKRGLSEFVFKRLDEKKEITSGKIKENKPVKEEKAKEKIQNSISEKQIKRIEDEAFKRGYEKGKQEGYEAGLQDGLKRADEFKKEYEAKREDYLNLLKEEMDKAIANLEEIRKIIHSLDEELPELVLGYVRELIGYERKINDELILSVFKKHIEKIKNIADAVIYVNPDDMEVLKEEYPDYNFQPNEEIPKGGFKIKTNIGEFDFTLETILKNFEKTLNEEIEAT